MRDFLRRSIELVLSSPLAFELQQRLCNDYGAVRDEFAHNLAGPDLRILDVGCSTGACAASIVDMESNEYHGIDIEERYIEMAQARYPKGRWRSCDARELDYEDDYFDRVLFTGVLHHMSDELIASVTREVARVIKPDGYVLVAEPVFTEGERLSSFLLSLDRGRFIRDREGYKSTLKGLDLVQESYFRFSVHRFCSLILKRSGPPETKN